MPPPTSIVYVGGNANSWFGVPISYSSTAGNSLFLGFATSSSNSVAVHDSNGTNWTIVASSSTDFYFAYIIKSPAITSVTITQSGAGITAAYVLTEYSNIVGIQGSIIQGSVGSGASFTVGVSQTLSSSNNWLIALGGSFPNVGAAVTSVTALHGNLRQSFPNANIGTYGMDNTGSGTVTDSVVVNTTGNYSLQFLAAEAIFGFDGSASPSGESAAFSVGTPIPVIPVSVSPSGETAAFAVGTSTATGTALILPSGVTATFAQGSPTATGTAVALPSGVTALFSVGTVQIAGNYGSSLVQFGWGLS